MFGGGVVRWELVDVSSLDQTSQKPLAVRGFRLFRGGWRSLLLRVLIPRKKSEFLHRTAQSSQAGGYGRLTARQLGAGRAKVDTDAVTPTAEPLGWRCAYGGALTVPEAPTPADLPRCVALALDAAQAHRRTYTARLDRN